MAEEADKDSKTEEATEKKIRDSIEKGQVPFAREVPAFASFLAILAFMIFFAQSGAAQLGGFLAMFVERADEWQMATAHDAMMLQGMVFMEIVQEVSTPAAGAPTVGGNPSVDRRNLSTEVAVQSGETIMLAGLINDESITGSSGVPGLSRLPIIGALFGQQSQSSDREEIVILITPTVIRDPNEARRLTDEYGRRFRALEPMRTEGSLHGGGER